MPCTKSILLTLPLVLACGVSPSAPASSPDFPVSPPTPAEIPPRLPADWVGHHLGASPGRWFDRGEMQRAADGEVAPTVAYDPNAVEIPEPARPTMILGDPETGRMYEIDMDSADMALIADHLESLGYAEANDGDLPPAEPREPVRLGIVSGGVDSRVPLGIHEYGVVSEPYQKIGQLTSGCTGTLIGTPQTSYYIVTAAHCYWARETGAYLDPNFVPRRDGCRTPSGAVISGCDTTPYGTWDGGQWLMMTYFLDNCRGVENLNSTCIANDIAIQRIARPSGEAFPGAAGFGYWAGDDLAGFGRFNRGYPSCSILDGNVPPNCRSNTLFGDPASCALGDYTMPDGDNWNRVIRHGCDTNPGHSGSPLYLYSNGVKVFGVHSGGSGTSATPNVMRRITPSWYQSMLTFMGL